MIDPLYNQSDKNINQTIGLKLRERNENLISYFSTKTYVVGTQKNRLNETVLLSTKTLC